jgi:Glycosyltransferases involved in cell wall biogenesis
MENEMIADARGLVLIPAYNEEQNIAFVLNDLKKHVLKLGMDILVIDDGSTDNTAKIVEQEKVTVIRLPFNLNYGAALQTGFKYAYDKGYDYVVQFDADGQHFASEILKLINTKVSMNADIVIGTRFFENSSYRIGGFKKAGIIFLRLLVWLATGDRITDPTSGFQLLDRRVYMIYSIKGNFPTDYPDADVYISMRRSGFKIVETPAVMYRRSAGTSMHSGLKILMYFPKMLISVLAVIFRDCFQKEVK